MSQSPYRGPFAELIDELQIAASWRVESSGSGDPCLAAAALLSDLSRRVTLIVDGREIDGRFALYDATAQEDGVVLRFERVDAEVHTMSPELIAKISDIGKRDAHWQTVTDKIAAFEFAANEIDGVVQSDLSWWRKYEIVFAIHQNKIKPILNNLGVSFDWYDPDTTHEEDTLAYHLALMELQDDLRKSLTRGHND